MNRALVAGSLLVVAVAVGAASLARFHARPEVPLEVRNPLSGLHTARIVFHPALSSAPARLATAIADGLQRHGLRVEMLGPGGFAPTPVEATRVVVLVVPALFGSTPRAVRDALSREPLAGRRVILVVCPVLGSGRDAAARLVDAARRAGGVSQDPIVARSGEDVAARVVEVVAGP